MSTKVQLSNTKVQKIARLKDKAYRDAFVASQISVGLPFQLRSLREKRNMKQSELAQKTGMLQPRISAMESPGGAKFTLETLRRVASAFDVALVVRFAPFSELVRWSDEFEPDMFSVPSFEEDFTNDPLQNEDSLPQLVFAYQQLAQSHTARQPINTNVVTLDTYQSKIPIFNGVVDIPKMPVVSEGSQTSSVGSGREARTMMYAGTR